MGHNLHSFAHFTSHVREIYHKKVFLPDIEYCTFNIREKVEICDGKDRQKNPPTSGAENSRSQILQHLQQFKAYTTGQQFCLRSALPIF